MSTAPASIETVDFAVAYDGPALTDHLIEARDLAPALLGMAEAFERANDLLNGANATMALKIRATREGSFEVVVLLQQMWENATDFLSGDFVTSAVHIKELFFESPAATGASITANGFGVVALLKWLRGRNIDDVTEERDVRDADGTVRSGIFFKQEYRPDGSTVELEISREVVRLIKDREVRKGIGDMVKPLLKAGISAVRFRERDGEVLQQVTNSEAKYLAPKSDPVQYDPLGVTTFKSQRLQTRTEDFREDGKWRLFDGDAEHTYLISDESFTKKVRAQEVKVGPKDILVCDVTKTQFTTKRGRLKNAYEITAVHKIIPPGSQVVFETDDRGGIAITTTEPRAKEL